jgi:hypothetical protein
VYFLGEKAVKNYLPPKSRNQKVFYQLINTLSIFNDDLRAVFALFCRIQGTIRHNTDISFAQATPRTFSQKYNI